MNASRRAGLWVAQGALAAVVAWFVIVSLRGRWSEFRAAQVTGVAVPWVALAALLVFGAYAALIAAWKAVLTGWDQSLGFVEAGRIWCLSNLGRYLPGKVWSVAGLAVLAQQAGVAGWAAVAAAFAMQALAVLSGVVVVSIFAPTALPGLRAAVALLLALGSVVAVTSERFVTWSRQLLGDRVKLVRLPVRSALIGGAASTLAWILYGFAFLAVGRATGVAEGLAAPAAIGAFAGGYIVGLVALFAPGGLGVRELVLVSVLSPTVGAAGALVLSVGSRLLLTGTEILAALGAWTVSRLAGKEIEG